MNQYDRVIRDIQQKTGEDRLHWKVVQPSAHARLVMNPDRVVRAFSADYALAEKRFQLLFVEKKIDVPDGWGDVYESEECQLFVLDPDGEIVLSLYDGIVERDDLFHLAALIDEHNDRTKEFFAAFEKAAVA